MARPNASPPRTHRGQRSTLRRAHRYLAVILVACTLAWPEGVISQQGTVVVVGAGPERPLLEKLGRAFEQREPGRVVELRWHRTLKAADQVLAGEAEVAVTAEETRGLLATPIGWDGVALIVNFANSVHEITAAQAAGLFSGAIRSWSELGGAEQRVELIRRPPDRNLNAGLLAGLALETLGDTARPVRTDARVLSTVGGRLTALSYVSLTVALEARTFGAPIRLLLLDGIEPGEPTVADGRYALRRPVLLLTRPTPAPLVQAFLDFARSPEGQRLVDEFYVPYRP